jgi:hypothetical protein
MALVTANDVAVIEGTIVRPLVGVWTADLKLDQGGGTGGFNAGDKVTLKTDTGYSIKGVVDPNRGGSFLDSVHLRVIGGAGGMSKLSTPRAFGAGAFVRDVINGLMSDAGDTLSSTTDAGLLGTSIGGWSVMGHTVGWNLRALLRIVAPSMSWRILPDGTLWIGTETWPSATGTFDAIDQDPADGSYVLGVEAPFVVPGTNIADLGNVNRCIDVISAGRLRTHVYVDFPSEGTRGINAAITRQVTQALAGVDYYASYVCQVVSQSADLTTVDVQPQGARNQKLLGGLQSIPVRVGTGIKIQFSVGATVLLSWDGGNPASPYVCCGLSSESATAIQLAGSTPAARQNDPVTHGTLVLAFTPGAGAAALSVTYNPGDGGAAQILATGTGTIVLGEKILSGSSIVGMG